MSHLGSRRRPSDSIPTSSMADIAFLLLVFFLVTTVFPDDRGLALALPEEGPVVELPPENLLQLLVRPDGTVEVRHGDSPQGLIRTAGQLPGIWREAAGANPLLVAAVRTHPEAAYGRMVDVLDGLQQAGARRISLQLLEEGR